MSASRLTRVSSCKQQRLSPCRTPVARDQYEQSALTHKQEPAEKLRDVGVEFCCFCEFG